MALNQRHVMRLVGLVILLIVTAFFVVPMIWLFLAPTKTDGQLLTESPFAFGSLNTLFHTFHRIITYSDDSLLIWLKNSAIYSFGGTALAIVAAIPAGYGLALTHFIGRRALLSITLVVMIMPATALVLPLFLEINKLGLYGTIWSLILPFGSSPSASISPTSTSLRRSRKTFSLRQGLMGRANGACSGTLLCRSRARSWRSSASSHSSRRGTTSSYRS